MLPQHVYEVFSPALVQDVGEEKVVEFLKHARALMGGRRNRTAAADAIQGLQGKNFDSRLISALFGGSGHTAMHGIDARTSDRIKKKRN